MHPLCYLRASERQSTFHSRDAAMQPWAIRHIFPLQRTYSVPQCIQCRLSQRQANEMHRSRTFALLAGFESQTLIYASATHASPGERQLGPNGTAAGLLANRSTNHEMAMIRPTRTTVCPVLVPVGSDTVYSTYVAAEGWERLERRGFAPFCGEGKRRRLGKGPVVDRLATAAAAAAAA